MVCHRWGDLEVFGGRGSTGKLLSLSATYDRRPRCWHRLPGHVADRGKVPDETTGFSICPTAKSAALLPRLAKATGLWSGEKVIALPVLRYTLSKRRTCRQCFARVPTDTNEPSTTPSRYG